MTGRIDVGATGPKQLTLNEDGLDYAAVSLQPIPAGDYIPLMFTARNMNVKGDNGELQGSYFVPSYRGSSFMDPRVRCLGRPVTVTAGHATNNHSKDNMKP